MTKPVFSAPLPLLLAVALAACSSSTTNGSPSFPESSSDAGPAALINGCTSYADNTASGVSGTGLDWGFGIGADVNHCSKIKAGQSVTWTGNFSTHPLGPFDDSVDGGVPSNSSPVTSGSASGQGSVTITFPTPGTYGYWCTHHKTAMMGAIVVE